MPSPMPGTRMYVTPGAAAPPSRPRPARRKWRQPAAARHCRPAPERRGHGGSHGLDQRSARRHAGRQHGCAIQLIGPDRGDHDMGGCRHGGQRFGIIAVGHHQRGIGRGADQVAHFCQFRSAAPGHGPFQPGMPVRQRQIFRHQPPGLPGCAIHDHIQFARHLPIPFDCLNAWLKQWRAIGNVDVCEAALTCRQTTRPASRSLCDENDVFVGGPTTNDTIMLWWSGGEAGRVVCVARSATWSQIRGRVTPFCPMYLPARSA